MPLDFGPYQGTSHIHAAYLLNVSAILVVRTNKCSSNFDYVPSLDECLYESENQRTFYEAVDACKARGMYGVYISCSICN